MFNTNPVGCVWRRGTSDELVAIRDSQLTMENWQSVVHPTGSVAGLPVIDQQSSCVVAFPYRGQAIEIEYHANGGADCAALEKIVAEVRLRFS